MITIFLPFLISGQNYELTNWSIEDGLSSDEVRDILQDKDGFIWLATSHGLNKFDGYAFQNYRFHPFDSTSIGANYINKIEEDKEGNIWVQLGVGFISKWNRRTNDFTRFSFPDRSTYIIEMKIVADSSLMISTSKGLFQLDQSNLKVVPLLDSMAVYKVNNLSDSTFLLSTERGALSFNRISRQLNSLQISKDSVSTMFNRHVINVQKDQADQNWLITNGGEIFKQESSLYFQKTINRKKHIKELPLGKSYLGIGKDGEKWTLSEEGQLMSWDGEKWKSFPTEKIKGSFLFSDKEQAIWMFAKNNDLLKWNGEQWLVEFSFDDHFNFWEVMAVCVDNENGIWFGTRDKGVWRLGTKNRFITKLSPINSTSPINFNVVSLLYDDAALLWLGTTNNLFKYSIYTNELTPIFNNLISENPVASLGIKDIAQQKNGNLWLATNNGLVYVDLLAGTTNRYFSSGDNNSRLSHTYIRCINVDPKNRIWVGTLRGLDLYDREANRFITFDSIKGLDVRCITSVSDSTFFVGYVKEGADFITYHEGDQTISIQKVSYASRFALQHHASTVNVITKLKNGQFVAGTYSRGLMLLDIENLQLNFMNADFPIIPNILGMKEIKTGELWVSAIDGIRQVNLADQTFFKYSKSSGLLSNSFININPMEKDESGRLYFGNQQGVNVIEPSKWSFTDTISTPILTRLKSREEVLYFDTPLNEKEQIIVDYQNNYLTFEFVAPTYQNAKEVQYAYKLEGLDEQWHYSDAERSATYINVPYGDYAFKVKAGNSGGFLNSSTKELQVVIKPPFWKTMGFKLLLLFSMLFLAWLFYALKWKLKMKELEIMETVRKKSADDFHDELGHRLTKISLFVETLMIRKDTFPKESLPVLKKIQDNTNELYDATKDFIWAMNPSSNTVLELVILLKDFGEELFEDTSIDFNVLGIEESFKKISLDMDWTRQIILIFKEGMNNSLKHSECTAVQLSAQYVNKQLILSLVDNGKGFKLENEKFGFGLNSMLNRSKKINGQLRIESTAGNGTKMKFIK